MIDAVLMAGRVLEEKDELLKYAGVRKKSLIKIGGKEMVRYVVEAIAGCPRVDHIVLVGLGPEDGVELGVPVEYVAARGDILDNCMAGMDHLEAINPSVEWVIFSSTDIPLLTTEVVDYFIDACLESEADISYAVVEKSVMEARYAEAGRTFVTLRDGSFAGGDMFMIRSSAVQANLPLIHRIIDARKSPWRLVKLIGLKMIFKFLTRQLTIAEAEELVSRALNCRSKAILSSYAEIGMDVDKVHQLQFVRAIIEGRCSL